MKVWIVMNKSKNVSDSKYKDKIKTFADYGLLCEYLKNIGWGKSPMSMEPTDKVGMMSLERAGGEHNIEVFCTEVIGEMKKGGTCKLINDIFSWRLEVDGYSIIFSGAISAGYFAEHYKALGYDVEWYRRKHEGGELVKEDT